MTYNFDPELIDIIPLIPKIDFRDPVAAREQFLEMISAINNSVDASAVHIEDKILAGLNNKVDVPVRVYTPKDLTSPAVPGLLHIHGGGFVIGNIDAEHGFSVMLARELGVVVVSVDYRLAPEHPFPAGLEDCYATLNWMHNNAGALNLDADRIGVFGQSAGGGLAAALALYTRDLDGPSLCFQFLGMPELDDRLDTVSMRTFTDTPMWNLAGAKLSWAFYLGNDITPGSADVSHYAAPARATDLAGLPPAYVSAMEFDPLRDEDINYALRLLGAGVQVELHSYPGTFHGSSLVESAAVSQRMKTETLEALRRGLRIKASA